MAAGSSSFEATPQSNKSPNKSNNSTRKFWKYEWRVKIQDQIQIIWKF